MQSIAVRYEIAAACRYALRVKTVEQVRLERYRQLLTELETEPGVPASQADVARALGISPVYVHQLEHGKRSNIDSKAARKIEASMGKEIGWMDSDPDLWPFNTISMEQFSRLPERFKGMAEQEVRRVIEEWESSRQRLGGLSA